MQQKKQNSRLLPWLVFVCLGSSFPVFAAGSQTVQASKEVKHDVSLPLRQMRPLTPPQVESGPDPETAQREGSLLDMSNAGSLPVDQSQQSFAGPKLAAIPGISFDGVSSSGWAAPDTNGAVGATQFVEWVNTRFAVYDKKTGALLYGPAAGNTLWSGFGGGCEANNNGDAIAQYDKAAGRWIMTQRAYFSQPYLQCFAISMTSDATGSWFRYAFPLTTLIPDYPKIGTWSDAYYYTVNLQSSTNGNAGAAICALDRNAMLNGQTATSVCFTNPPSLISLLPSDWDGANPPPAGSPNYLLNLGTNSLNMWKFHVDFQTPSNSSFTGPTAIAVAPFTQACGGNACVPQSGTAQGLDSLGDRLMYRLAYRHFPDGHESMVVTHSVGSPAGIRWYEIRSPGTTPVVYQQGTFSPDSNWRWMGSIAMDQAGDIAVGYSESSSAMSPAIYYTGRVPSDPSGSMQGETLIIAGAGSQTGSYRWGDYTSMSIDPVDDCTFWYANEYLQTAGSSNWHTHIASFKFPACGTGSGQVTVSPPSLTFAAQPVGTTSPGQTVTVTNNQIITLNFTGITTSGDFAETDTCGSSLLPSASCTITVTFTPITSGPRTGNLTISDDAANSPQTVSLSGTGLASTVTLSMTSMVFPGQAVTTTSQARSIILTNSGGAAVSVNSVSASGSYGESDNCTGNVIQPLGTCAINVSFSPSFPGRIPGEITVIDTAANSPQLVTLSGTGVTPLSYSPVNINFGSVNVGTNATRTVTLNNNLTTSLNLSFSASGAYSAVGNGSVPCGTSLAAGTKCTIAVTFSPNANGTMKGAITIASNALFSPQLISLSGVGINGTTGPLTFSTNLLTFSNVAVGTASNPKTITMTNIGTVMVNISSLTASGNFSASGSGTHPCGGALAGGAQCTFAVTFTPTLPATVSGSVTISDDAEISPQVLGLSASGIFPITFSPTSLSFAPQAVGTTSGTQTITLTNNLNTMLTLNGIVLSGDYIITSNSCAGSIAAKGTCSVGVAFSPTQIGSVPGVATINYTGGFSPETVTLSGTGQ